MRKKRFSPLYVILFAVLMAHPVLAQDVNQRPEQFSAAATAIDGVSVLTSRFMISLWGVEPIEAAGTTVSIKARTALDNLIGGLPVQCEVKEWRTGRPVARCLNAKEADLALAMVEAGYAVVDRPAVSGTVFDVQYKQAETKAQNEQVGAWAEAAKDSAFMKFFGNNEQFVYLWIIGVLTVPLLSFLAMAALVSLRIGKLERFVEQTLGASEERSQELREQERFVVASMLEGELSANKGKLEAFTIIYNDLLKSLRQSKDHRYQTSGEIVHDAPLLERAVYDGNINRLGLLGSSMAGEITGLYSHVQSNPNYTTLDNSVPLDQAILKVQKVVTDAEAMIPRIDKIIQSLHVTIRDKQTRQVRSIR